MREHLAAWGRTGDAVDAAMLVVSEPATNAVRHGALGDREFEVAVTVLADGSCFVEVTDTARRSPVPRVAADEDESGRGLHLVQAVAEARGVWHRGAPRQDGQDGMGGSGPARGRRNGQIRIGPARGRRNGQIRIGPARGRRNGQIRIGSRSFARFACARAIPVFR
ncbi:ATP-binding protein [Streptomyces varsoviensis]|uniref:ATP-binding protein n=1 Tax=Streptomyces varsoviensis TaxID=67373 RepID=UPI0033DA3D13